MPGGISLFLLWGAPVAAMFLGAIIGVVFYKQGVKRAGRTAFNGVRRLFFKKSYKNYLRNQMLQYDKELSNNRLLGKRFARGYTPRRPSMRQRAMQKLHLGRYEPRELKPREQDWRKKRIHHIQNYLNKYERTSDAPYVDYTARPVEDVTDRRTSDYAFKFESKKEYLKSPRFSSIAMDHSILSTSSKQTQEKFTKLTSDEDFKKRAILNKDNTLYNSLHITTRDEKSIPLESFKAKDKEVFFTISGEILKHISTTAPEEIYPVKVVQTIVKAGKEVREERILQRDEVEKLIKSYETKTQNKKTYSSEEYSKDM